MNTEEDVKAKVILPFLIALGIDSSELEFEKSFTIHPGRQTIEVNTARQVSSLSPRLDILVKRNGANLFVVEAKTDGSHLTEDNAEQAISYARLVHPMAPIAVVTNGKQTKLFKTGDKSEIPPDKDAILNYRISDDLGAIYEEAVECFVGYSAENLRTFCTAQVTDRMKTLQGSRQKSDRKYISDLYVLPKKLHRAVTEFMNSEKPVFAVVGESGAGKTCALCHLSLSYLETNPVLFFRGAELSLSLSQSMAEDFNWQFSGTHDPITVLRRVDRILKGRSKMLIIVDGVDEWFLPNRVSILGDFARHIRDRGFKLILSCKDFNWSAFQRESGIPSALSEEVFPAGGYLMDSFDDEEYHQVIAKYRAFYGFRGPFEKEVFQECRRQPFLLRVMFEVAERTQTAYLTFSLKEFYQAYLNAVIERIPESKREVAGETLKAVAAALFNERSDAIGVDRLRADSTVAGSVLSQPELFERDILEKTGDPLDVRVGFYFQKLRDYIIAFHVRKWDKATISEFEKEVQEIGFADVRRDVLALFYQLCEEEEKKRGVDNSVYPSAKAYVEFYQRILDEYFPGLKRSFPPYSESRVGLVGYLNMIKKTIGAIGFRAISQDDQTVRLVPTWSGVLAQGDDRLFLLGAHSLHYRGSSKGFRNIDVKKEVLKHDVAEEITTIVKEGRLNESGNYYLSLEKTLGIIVASQRTLHGIENEARMSSHLPIKIETIEFGLRYARAYRIFSDKIVQEKGTRRGSQITYSYTTEDRDSIHQLAHDAAVRGVLPNTDVRYLDSDAVETMLTDALQVLNKRKPNIDETILPDEDAYGRRLEDSFTIATLESAVHRLVTLFLAEYKTLIEVNFPKLKEAFRLYSLMPVRIFVTIEEGNSAGDQRTRISLYKCRVEGSGENEVIVCRPGEASFDYDSFLLSYRDSEFSVLKVEGFSLFPYHQYLSIRVPPRFAVLRGLVYGQISAELAAVLEQLFGIFGVR